MKFFFTLLARRLLNRIWTVFLFCSDSLIPTFLSCNNRQRLLCLIRLDNIGDFILWLDSARQIREFYQDREITLIANRTFSDLAQQLPYWDNVVPVDVSKLMRNIVYRWRLLSSVRRMGADTVIHPIFSREFLTGDTLVRASGARNRIGSTGDLSNLRPWQKKISDRWYSKLIPANSKTIMELQRNAEFLRGIGVSTNARIAQIPNAAKLQKKLQQDQPYYILFPGASRTDKRWPVTSFVKVAEKIYKSTGFTGWICGSPGERSLGEKLMSCANAPLKNMAGETSLPELVEVIRSASFLVGNDTSAVHIAAAVDTPCVCLLGGGHHGRFLPYEVDEEEERAPHAVIHRMDCYGCNWCCKHKAKKGDPTPCIAGISLNDVLMVVYRIIDNI